MGLFRSKKPSAGNELNEMSAQPERRTDAFHGTLNDIKATPKADASKPDSRLEDLSRKTFF